MPIYEYQCKKCDGVFEAIQKFSDEPLSECRLCGEGEVRKLMSAPAFRLKGSGWYETDFKSGNQRNISKSDTDSGSGSGSGSDAKVSDSKTSGDSSGGGSGGASKGASGDSSGGSSEKKSSPKSDASSSSSGGKKPDAA